MYEFSELKTHGAVSGAISRAGLLVLLSPLPLVVVVFCSFVFGVWCVPPLLWCAFVWVFLCLSHQPNFSRPLGGGLAESRSWWSPGGVFLFPFPLPWSGFGSPRDACIMIGCLYVSLWPPWYILFCSFSAMWVYFSLAARWQSSECSLILFVLCTLSRQDFIYPGLASRILFILSR